ncbi:VOC family protein [Micromonospora sp. NPDC047548]|uniref:VOC family protein n=1 Tax=Micromonospora sp. NPDC047548 TaxID=3155624 RepID=UPI0033FB866B
MTIDCADPRRMVAFWAEALGYVPEPPPGGHRTWRAYWAETGVPAEELPDGVGDGPESIVDPAGRAPRIWFQQVPEGKPGEPRTDVGVPVAAEPWSIV